MFGYIVIHEQELRVREVSFYRSFYCGLCEELLEIYGRPAQLLLQYDTAFLGLLLTSLYEPAEGRHTRTHCIVHPFTLQEMRRGPYTRYAAAMTVLLGSCACRDDWQDERRISRLALAGLLRGAGQKAAAAYPAQAEAIYRGLDRLHALEARAGAPSGAMPAVSAGFLSVGSLSAGSLSAGSLSAGSLSAGSLSAGSLSAGSLSAGSSVPASSAPAPSPGRKPEAFPTPDEAGACFGEILAAVFAPHEDEWADTLRRMGFFLGKFIYILDAYDDLDRDAKKGNFNPLLPVRDRMATPAPNAAAAGPPGSGHAFDDYVRALLHMLMASACQAFELLPIVENIDILRNILYAGVWTKFEEIYARRTQLQEGK